MKKRILACLLTVVMLVCALPLSAYAQVTPLNSESGGQGAEAPALDADENENEYEYAALYSALMACTTLEEAHALVEAYTDAELEAFLASLTEAENDALDAHMNALLDAAEDDGSLEYISSTTVNFTDAAPLLDPVVGETPTRGATAQDANPDNGLELVKTAVPNGDGTYTITVEVYTKGTVSEVTRYTPTDIVLVLDQSGSMGDDFNTYGYRPYSASTNSTHYGRRHNGGSGNLYHLLDDGTYVAVNVEREGIDHEPYSDTTTNSQYYNNSAGLYQLVDGAYLQVTVERTSSNGTYTYTFADGSTVTSRGRNGVPDFGAHGPLYYASDYSYTYSYTSNGVTTTIGVSDGESTTCPYVFYERYVTGTTTRLAALKSAVESFANSVAAQAAGVDGELGTDDDVAHRIAVVGFASGGTWGTYNASRYENTELFVGATQYTYNAGSSNNPNNASSAQSHYDDAFQAMNTTGGAGNVAASINALGAYGGTFVDYGIEMANGIFAAHPVDEGETRNRVVVVFTDGTPGTGDWDDDYAVDSADTAITNAGIAKTTYGATVYTVGIFDGADATSAGDQNGTDVQRNNWFMQTLSSNNGTPQSPSYYLSAGDSDALSAVFQSISEQISTPTIELDSSTEVRDIVSDFFALEPGVSASAVTLYTADANANSLSHDSWEDRVIATDLTPNIDGKTVSVTGFDFDANFVSSTARPEPGSESGERTFYGRKLIIELRVRAEPGFLGGYNVPTNREGSGVYNSNGDLIEAFINPLVDVLPIPSFTVTAIDKNVYLFGGLTSAQLLAGATAVTENGITLKLDEAGWGLEPWQYAYVDIAMTLTEESYTGLAKDTTYSVTLNISPLNGTEADTETGTDTADIHVFKPELTFADSEVWYGGAAPANYDANYRGVAWKHGSTLDTQVTMIGEKPQLTLEYAEAVAGVYNGGYVVTREDIPVNVTVKQGGIDIADHLLPFVHASCTHPGCEGAANSGAFVLHVNTATLTIDKNMAEGSSLMDANQSFIFTVEYGAQNGLAAFTLDVVVNGTGSQTITGLPLGVYAVSENGDWSWRYTASSTDTDPELTAANSVQTATFTNTLTETKWLTDDFSVENVFGRPVSSTDMPDAVLPGKEDEHDE
ncbi:MAG: hypothetical protein Q4B99_00700 [Clostridia bacterium]|nr:hypothetical protein [Clostridia bacterium]